MESRAVVEARLDGIATQWHWMAGLAAQVDSRLMPNVSSVAWSAQTAVH